MIVVEIFDRPSVEKGKARSLRRRQVFPELGIYILLDRRTRRFIFDGGNSKLERKTGADQSCRVTARKSKGAWICRNPDEFSRCRFSNVDAVRVSVSGNSEEATAEIIPLRSFARSVTVRFHARPLDTN